MNQSVIALIAFLFPLAYSPGPGNMFFAANGARFGFRATLRANLGYHAATWLAAAGIGLGFAAARGAFPAGFAALRLAGSVYVLWIAWKMFRAGALTNAADARPAGFLDGAILLALNPKAYMIIALMFTQFPGPAAHGQAGAVLMIASVFTLNNMAAFSVWTLAGDRIAARLRTPESARKLNMLFSGVLALVALWMLAA